MGITVKTEEQIRTEQGQVTRDGVYTLGRDRFRIRAGDVLPPGAVLDPEPVEATLEATEVEGVALPEVTDYPEGAKPIEAEEDAPEQRMQPAAPENRALQGAPSNRRKAKKDGE